MIVKSLAKLHATNNIKLAASSAFRTNFAQNQFTPAGPFRTFATDKKKSRDSQRRGARFGKKNKDEPVEAEDMLERALEQNFTVGEEVLSQDMEAIEKVASRDDFMQELKNSKFGVLDFDQSKLPKRQDFYERAATKFIEEEELEDDILERSMYHIDALKLHYVDGIFQLMRKPEEVAAYKESLPKTPEEAEKAMMEDEIKKKMLADMWRQIDEQMEHASPEAQDLYFRFKSGEKGDPILSPQLLELEEQLKEVQEAFLKPKTQSEINESNKLLALKAMTSALPKDLGRDAVEYFSNNFQAIFKSKKVIPTSLSSTLQALKSAPKSQLQDRAFLDQVLQQAEDFYFAAEPEYTQGALNEVYNFSQNKPINEENFEMIREHLRYEFENLSGPDFKALTTEVKKYIRSKAAMEEALDGKQCFLQDYNRIMGKDLRLADNNRFLAFLADIFYNTTPTTDTSKVTVDEDTGFTDLEIITNSPTVISPLLDRFLTLAMTLQEPELIKSNDYIRQQFLAELSLTYGASEMSQAHIFKLLNNPEFMMKFQVVSMAKNHNHYGQVDRYMREFAQIALKFCPPAFTSHLERVLNSEISIASPEKEGDLLNTFKDLPREIHENVLAQADFSYSPAGLKAFKIQQYLDLVKEQDRNREAINLLKQSTENPAVFNKLTKNFNVFFNLVKQLDADQSNKDLTLDSSVGVLEKLKKSSAALDSQIEHTFMKRFGIAGIGYSNMEQVYAPHLTGIGTMEATRNFLVSRGMTPHFAGLLASKYIKGLEEKGQTVASVIDLFNCEGAGFDAIKALSEVPMSSVAINYQTLSELTHVLNTQRKFNHLNALTQGQLAGNAHAFHLGGFGHTKSKVVRPVRPMAAARCFSSAPQKGKFFEFLKVVQETDEKVKHQEEAPVEEVAAATEEFEVAQESEQAEEVAAVEEVATAEEIEAATIYSASDIERAENQQAIDGAIEKFGVNFFHQFTGPTPKATQLNLEEFIRNSASEEDINQLLLSMIYQTYELNTVIPNSQMVLFKMFCSPQSTKDIRKLEVDGKVVAKDTGNNLLLGNIFAEKKVSLHPLVYKNLLETESLVPKKKHFKKIAAYLKAFEDPKAVKPQTLDLLIQTGINQKYPLSLGQIVRDLVVQDYNISKSTFMKFLLFMERCKGYEEDAKRFLGLINQSTHLQIDYDMIQPLIQRILVHKGGAEIVQYFEQLRKNIKLNESWATENQEVRHKEEKALKKKFFDGLIGDLMAFKNFTLSEIVMEEKLKEKFDVTFSDEIIALNIFSAQRKWDAYLEKFDLFMDENSEFEFTSNLSETLGSTLMEFSTEEFKNKRLQQIGRIVEKMNQKNIKYPQELFHSVIYIYTETQQWSDVIDILADLRDSGLCKPSHKTITYLKDNLMYCFQNNVRLEVQEVIDSFEKRFFSYQERQARKHDQKNKRSKQQQAQEDEMAEEEEFIDEKSLDKKTKQMMRREARRKRKEMAATEVEE